jgi:hypothetical protein
MSKVLAFTNLDLTLPNCYLQSSLSFQDTLNDEMPVFCDSPQRMYFYTGSLPLALHLYLCYFRMRTLSIVITWWVCSELFNVSLREVHKDSFDIRLQNETSEVEKTGSDNKGVDFGNDDRDQVVGLRQTRKARAPGMNVRLVCRYGDQYTTLSPRT